MQQLSSQDAMFAYLERPNTPLHLGWLNIYDPATNAGGKLDYKSLLDHVERRLHMVRFFRQKLLFVPGHLEEPYWVDDEAFKLENHIHHTRLPAPGEREQLRALTEQKFAQPLDFNRPLWELHLIEGLDRVAGLADGSVALLVKIHHAAVDGISGVDVATVLHTREPGAPPPERVAWQPAPVPGGVHLVTRALAGRPARSRARFGAIARSVPAFRKVRAALDAGDLRKPAKHKTPRTRFSGPVGPRRVFDAHLFRLDDIRSIRHVVAGATVNDVLLAVVGGALRRYLAAKDELPDLPLTAACPISLRADEERGEFGNRIANMFIALGTDVADVVERLRGIQQQTDSAKRMNEAIGARVLTELNELVPGALVSLGTRVAARVSGTGSTNTIVTNVPGPQEPLYLAGARLRSQFALGTLLDGMGLFHFIYSYCGEVTLTVTADEDKLPDPLVYGRMIEDSFEELWQAARSTTNGRKA